MAENGHLTNNDNSSLRTTTVLEQGRSESDATHFRLRGDLHAAEDITCLSCGQTFKSTSLLQIYEHYGEHKHPRQFGNCLYCQGKVHQYFNVQKQQVCIYHNCFRWKRGEDK